MSKIIFSAFLNSRGRPALLENALDSLYATCSDAESLETLVRCDSDDLETIEFLKTADYPNLRYFVGPRPSNLIESYNELVSKAVGEYLFVLNDDVQILTENFDLIALEKIDDFKRKYKIWDNVLMCSTSDTSIDKTAGQKYSSFVIISKEAVMALGYFMNEKYVTLGADAHISRIYYAIDRVVDCSDILLDHIFHNDLNKVLNPDLTAHEYRQKAWITSPDPFSFDITEEVNKLKKYISNDANN